MSLEAKIVAANGSGVFFNETDAQEILNELNDSFYYATMEYRNGGWVIICE